MNNSQTQIKNICIFCGSSDPSNPEYAAKTAILGEEMVKRGLGLVYGGGTVGLMGVISRKISEGESINFFWFMIWQIMS